MHLRPDENTSDCYSTTATLLACTSSMTSRSMRDVSVSSPNVHPPPGAITSSMGSASRDVELMKAPVQRSISCFSGGEKSIGMPSRSHTSTTSPRTVPSRTVPPPAVWHQHRRNDRVSRSSPRKTHARVHVQRRTSHTAHTHTHTHTECRHTFTQNRILVLFIELNGIIVPRTSTVRCIVYTPHFIEFDTRSDGIALRTPLDMTD